LKGLKAGNTAIYLGRWANPPHSQKFSDYRNQSEAMPKGFYKQSFALKRNMIIGTWNMRTLIERGKL
jgi:hypothetical protein